MPFKLLALFLFCLPFQSQAYSGASATEAKMRMTYFLEIPKDEYVPNDVSDEVAEHLDHMFGPMTYRPANSPTRAADKGDGSTTILRVEKTGDVVRVHYSYETTLVLGHGPQKYYEFALPRNPRKAYEKSSLISPNPCTDETYDSYDDFFYFWSPDHEGCGEAALIPGVDYDIITSEIERIPNTSTTYPTRKASYPEYDRLPDVDKQVQVVLLMGLNKPEHNRNPMETQNQDENAPNYRGIRRQLIRLGFKSELWENSKIRSIVKEDTRPLPHVETLTKTFPTSNQRAQKMSVTMFFGKTGIDEASKGFHYFLKDALANASVVIYDGHSGLGGHLNLKHIERLRTETSGRPFKFYLPRERYQIFYFNSCSSYTYYNKMFFNLKKRFVGDPGTKNLDIVTTGLETAFDGSVETNMELIRTVHNWIERRVIKSYRTLVKNLENDNLAGVNGDEDNPVQQY